MRTFLLLLVILVSNLYSQSIVFSDNFDGLNYSSNTNGVFYNKWNTSRSGNDWGVSILNNMMNITNNYSTTVGNLAGNEMVYLDNTNIPFFNSVLSQNSSEICWSFNIRQSREDPSGFDAAFATAFVIATNVNENIMTSGKGYALVFGQSSTTTDPVQLVQYSNGLTSIVKTTSIISCSGSLSDVGIDYINIKVYYNPSNNLWKIYGNKGTSFSIANGSISLVGNNTNSTFVNESLPYSGFVMHYSPTQDQIVLVDNFSISLTVPTISTINFPPAATNTLNWTLPANYDAAKMETIIFLKEGTDIVTGLPTKNISTYIASAEFGNGSPFEFDPAAFCIYKGDNSTLDIANLKPDVEYYAIAYLTDGINIYSAPTKSNGILPVELTSFNANIKSNGVELNWITATETNNYGFEIQRSLESNIFETISFIKGNGSSASEKRYTYLDNSLTKPGTYSYRLKQIDTDGSYEYSSSIKVNYDRELSYTLEQNYPNPFNPTTNIQFSIPSNDIVKLALYDLLGREIKILLNQELESGVHKIKLDASDLPSGMYIYKLITSNYTSSKKLLLMK